MQSRAGKNSFSVLYPRYHSHGRAGIARQEPRESEANPLLPNMLPRSEQVEGAQPSSSSSLTRR